MSAADTREQTLSSVKSNAPVKNTIIFRLFDAWTRVYIEELYFAYDIMTFNI